jgi:hypothetical protein
MAGKEKNFSFFSGNNLFLAKKSFSPTIFADWDRETVSCLGNVIADIAEKKFNLTNQFGPNFGTLLVHKGQ